MDARKQADNAIEPSREEASLFYSLDSGDRVTGTSSASRDPATVGEGEEPREEEAGEEPGTADESGDNEPTTTSTAAAGEVVAATSAEVGMMELVALVMAGVGAGVAPLLLPAL